MTLGQVATNLPEIHKVYLVFDAFGGHFKSKAMAKVDDDPSLF
jgi:hypothetical protein